MTIIAAFSLITGLISGLPAKAVGGQAAQPATSPPPASISASAAGGAGVDAVSTSKNQNSTTLKFSTTTPGDLIVAFVGSDSPTSARQSSVVSGGGLTWTQVASENVQMGDAEIWAARAPGILNQARISAKETIAGWSEALTVVAFKNSRGVGAVSVANSPSGAPTGTLTTTAPNSWVWAIGDDPLEATTPVPGANQNVVRTITDKADDNGESALDGAHKQGDTYWVQSAAAATPAAGTPVTINDTAPAADAFNMALVEILGIAPPTVTGVIPPSGPVSGQNAVTVTGTDLTGAFEVDFGTVKVTAGISVAPDGTSLTVEAPPGSVGPVDVRVVTPAGETAITSADQYTYTAPAATAYSGAQLVLTPVTAGPNAPHTTQTLKATLTNAASQPMAGMELAFTVTGANPASMSVPTDASGTAVFTYTGDSAGTDTVTAKFQAGPDSVTSQPATVTWAAPTTPVAPVSMDPLQGQFFAEPSSATTFVAKPGDTPVFAQTFPDLAFNPPAGVIAGDHFPPSPTTHPLTDVTTDVAGNANGTIPAQGNGQQAGVAGLASFDAVFTTTLHVSQAGDLSYAIDSADGFLLGIGNGASRVSGDYINPPASNVSAFNAYPLVAVSDQPSGGTVVTHPVTIHFPTAGDYPVEIDYFSTAGPQLSLVFQPSTAVATAPNTPPFNVYVGYEDTLRASNDFTISPLPWFGSPGVTFEGDSTARGPGADSGGIRFDNVTNAPVTIDKVTVDVPVPNSSTPVHYDQWPSGVVIQPGQTLILTENAGFASFDTSDDEPGTCGVVRNLVPLINVTIGGVTTTYKDTGEVLNTGGFDQACIGNESQPWVRVATTGPANPLAPPPRVGAAAAWDDQQSALVMFGGYDAAQAGLYLGDTWVWQKDAWTAISSPTAPAARAYAAGVYDKATNTFVLFGGYNTQTGTNYSDTWTFDGTTWTQQHPAHSPPALNEASDKMAYDDATGTVVLVTSNSLGSQSPDTWTWDGTDWTEHASATQPTARWQPAMAYDQDTSSLVLFGGSAGYGGTRLNDTWQWDGTNWTQLSPATSPGPRAAASMDYDSAAHGLLLFGGDQGPGETWLYKNGTWSQLTPAVTPPGRGYAASAYDPVDQAEIVAFGGAGGSVSQPLGDLWLFNAGDWGTHLAAAASPAVPPASSLAISPGLAQAYPAGQAQTFTVSAVGANGQPLAGLSVAVGISGANATSATVTTGAGGTATFTDQGSNPGTDQVQATATIAGTSVASNAVNLTWTAPAGPPPVIAAAAPTDGSVVRTPIPVTANLTPPAGQTITSWAVTAQDSTQGSPVITLASGTGTPPSALATFDPTVLANGQYNLTITATASGGGTQTLTSSVSVSGAMKLGAYQATYHEFTLPVDGVNFSLDRVYSSIDHSAGDFGTGWHVSMTDFQVGTGRPLGSGGWQQYVTSCGFLSCNYAYTSPTHPHSVTVTWPDGHQEVWDLAPAGSSFGGLLFISPSYKPRPGTDTLDSLTSGGSLAFGDDGNLYDSTFAQVSDGTVFNPTEFTLTARDGTVYLLSTTSGLVSETTPAGVTVNVDASGVHASDGQSITFTRDPSNGNRITEIAGPDDGVNGMNQHWSYSYNAAGELAAVTDPVTTVHYSYDPASGELLQSTDASNQPLTTITYTPDGRVATIAHGSNPPTQVTTSTAASSQTVTDPNGQLVTTQLFDASGDLVEQDQAVGTTTLKTTHTYDSSGRLTSTTDPQGNVTAAAYDETPGSSTEGDLLSTTDADGRTWTYTAYSKTGMPGETVNPDGSVADVETFDPTTGAPLTGGVPGLAPTSYSYNANGTVAAITAPTGVTTSFTYDAAGNAVKEADGAGDTVTAAYDAAGNLTKETVGASETDFAYDGNGDVTSAGVAGHGGAQTAVYNGFGEPTSVTDQDGKTTSYTYDTSGHVLTRKDPDGEATTYSYDADGNLIAEQTPAGTTHYAYDALGNLIEADNAASELNLSYDAAGHLLTQTSCAPQAAHAPCPGGSPTVSHAVDAAGLVTATSTPDGTTAYTYNSNESLATVTDLSGRVFVYGYDPQGRQNTLIRPNGTADVATFNDADQPLSLTTTGPGGTILAKGADTIDPATGLVTQMTDLAGANSYTYNPDGTLASASHPASTGLAAEAYTYDAAGNRITGPTPTATSTYDAADRLLSDGTSTYTWTGEGNLATATSDATGVKTTYTWSADGQLLGASDTAGNTVTNSYDPLGRLASETANGTTTTYQWDGQTLLSETVGGATTDMVTQPGSGGQYAGTPYNAPAQTLEVTTGSGSVSPVYNLHGDWTSATNATGHLTQPVTEYSAFGAQATSGTLPGSFDGYLPVAGGLDYAYGRFYSPQTGSFLSADPISGPNPYSYAGSSPVSFYDPSGNEDAVEEAGADAEAASLAAEGDTEVTVYKGVESSGKCYVGITKNIINRGAQHGARFPKGIVAVVKARFTRGQARIIEQQVINYAQKNAISLTNKINSIAPGGPLWNLAVSINVPFLDAEDTLASIFDAFSECP